MHRPVEYRIFSYSDGEPLDAIEMHVLARAYRAAWRAMFARDPTGAHMIPGLDLLFVFEARDARHPQDARSHQHR